MSELLTTYDLGVAMGALLEPLTQLQREYHWNKVRRHIEALESRLREAEAGAAALRTALGQLSMHCDSDDPSQCTNPLCTGHIAKAALSGSAGRSLLEELEALREVAEAAGFARVAARVVPHYDDETLCYIKATNIHALAAALDRLQAVQKGDDSGTAS